MALKWFRRKEEEPKPGEPAGAAPAAEAPPSDQSVFARLKQGLSKTHNKLVDGLKVAVGLKSRIDEETLDEIEEVLLAADAGTMATKAIIQRIRDEESELRENTAEGVLRLVRDTIATILNRNQRKLDLNRPKPLILLMVGVNGTGKTTTIGKMALQFKRAGKSVMLVAGDTFRAAAIEQLEIWAKRVEAGFVSKEQGSDPASVCFEALEAARKDPPDIILVDSAGRLHTKTYLMDELDKMIRVMKKVYPDAPHEVILTLDATTGQNALQQVKTFNEVVKLTGLVMTKLDGTAKGGALLAVKEAAALPIYKIGVGEGAEDLQDFEPHRFAEALFANPDEA